MDYRWCFQEATTQHWPLWSLTEGDFGLEGTLTSTTVTDAAVGAKPIFVAYQSSDQAALVAATTTRTREAVATSDGSKSFVSPTQLSSTRTSLPGGTVAGIVIGVLFAGAMIAAVLTFVILRFWLGYRKRSSNERDNTEDVRVLGSNLQVSNSHHHGQPGALPELPSQGQTMSERTELADSRKGGDTVRHGTTARRSG